MNKFPKLVVGGLLSAILILPLGVQAQTSNEDLQRELLLQLIAALQQQIELLQAELESRQENYVNPTRLSELGDYGSRVETVAAYRLDHPRDAGRILNSDHRSYFLRVFELIPEEFDRKISQVLVFDGKDVEFDAFVETVPPDHKEWTFAAHEELISEASSDFNTELIIHELAHIFSYETVSGVEPTYHSCESYFDWHGCPASNSYLRVFTEEFWDRSDLEEAEDIMNDRDPYEASLSYYEDHEEDYVSDYATFGPEEDFAESFMFFVLRKQVEGNLANQKIDFFAEYPEMLSIKAEILENR